MRFALLLGLTAGAVVFALPEAASAQVYDRHAVDLDRFGATDGRIYTIDDDDDGDRTRWRDRRYDEDRFERDSRRPRFDDRGSRGRQGDDDDDD
jgi:hypothetical protein